TNLLYVKRVARPRSKMVRAPNRSERDRDSACRVLLLSDASAGCEISIDLREAAGLSISPSPWGEETPGRLPLLGSSATGNGSDLTCCRSAESSRADGYRMAGSFSIAFKIK